MEKLCPGCGADLQRPAGMKPLKFCPKCGADLNATEERPVDSALPPPRFNKPKRNVEPQIDWKGVGLLCVVVFYATVIKLCVDPLFTRLRANLGVDDAQAGIAGGVFHTAYGLFIIPGGFLADRANRKWVVVVCMAIAAITTALLGFCNSYEQLLVLWGFRGASFALATPSFVTLMLDFAPKNMWNRMFALYMIPSAVGGAVAYISSSMIARQLGFQYAFFTIGLIGVLFAALATRIKENRNSNEYNDVSSSYDSKNETGIRKPHIKAALFWLFVAIVIFDGANSEMNSWMMKFAERYHGVSPYEMALHSLFLYTMISLVVGLCAAYYADVLKEKKPLISYYMILAGFSIGALFYLGYIRVGDAQWIPWFLGPFFVITAIANIPATVLPLTLVRPDRRGVLYAGFIFVGSFFIEPITPFIIGYFSDMYNLRVGLTVLISLFIPVGAACMLAAIRASVPWSANIGDEVM